MDGPEVAWDASGLVPAIVQDRATGAVLMLGYMNRDALERTLATREVWFYSRSRARLWKKGETSGNRLQVESVTADCDGDALLVQATPTGPTCHTGEPNCFFTSIDGDKARDATILGELLQVLQARRRERPEASYTTRLFDGGIDRIGKKVIEEAGEAVIAAKNQDPPALVGELADLWFHSLVLMVERDVPLAAVLDELRLRRGQPPRPGPA